LLSDWRWFDLRVREAVAGSLAKSGIAIIVMVAVAQCLPLWEPYWFNSHENGAYPVRVVEFEAALRQGDLYPRWASDFYGGYGSPFFVFYAPLVFMAGAALSAVLGSPVLGLKLWIVIASILAGLGVRFAVATETRRDDAAVLAALLYLSAAYRLTDLYIRGDIAEYTALAVLPWAVGAYRRVARAMPLETAAPSATLAVGAHAGLLYSHAIFGLWGTWLLGATCLVTTFELWQRRAFRHVTTLWTAFALSLALGAAYLGPALVQKRYVHIAIATTDFYDPSNQLLAAGRLLGIGQFGLVPLVGAALALALVTMVVRRRGKAGLVWALAAALFAFLSIKQAEAFWMAQLPLTRFIQFPWRLHGLAALAAAFAVGCSWAVLMKRRSWREPLALTVGATALLVTAPLCNVPEVMARGSFPTSANEIRRGMHHTTADEYLPLAVAKPPTVPVRTLVTESPKLQVLDAFSHGTVHELELTSTGAARAELKLHMFPGWRVETLQGPARAKLTTSKTGLVAVELPQAGHYRLRVRFGTSPVRLDFGLFSLAAALATWPLLRTLCRGRARELVLRRLPVPATERLAA
jgi:hypothetical protein